MTRSKISHVGVLIIAALMSFFVVSCARSSGDEHTIRVGSSPGPYSELFKKGIEPILEKQGYTIEYTDFSDLQNADNALAAGLIDLNVDQHSAYMNVFNKEKRAKLTSLVKIRTVPASLYSSRHTSIDQITGGHTVAIPLDASNQSRAYNILVKAGWITLKDGTDRSLITRSDIAENPYNLDIKPMDAEKIPGVLHDVDWAVIPASDAYSSQVDPSYSQLKEDLRDELYLVAVTTEDKKDFQWSDDVIKAYKSDEFAEFMKKENTNNYWVQPLYNE